LVQNPQHIETRKKSSSSWREGRKPILCNRGRQTGIYSNGVIFKQKGKTRVFPIRKIDPPQQLGRSSKDGKTEKKVNQGGAMCLRRTD